MNFFKKNAKILIIIGGLLTIFSLFTPTSFHTEPGSTYFVWMNQIYLEIVPTFTIGLLRFDITLNIFSTAFSVIIFSSSIISITTSFIYRKLSVEAKRHKRNLLILAFLIAISTLAWIIMMEVYYRIYGYPHWSIGGGGYIPHFGVIGPFIGSIFIGLGVLLERNDK
ncbi:MAG: hypothetical protein ACFE9N_09780 [Promethearchaeota archaeon]